MDTSHQNSTKICILLFNRSSFNNKASDVAVLIGFDTSSIIDII
jgi:hypothetical protein